MNKIAVGPSTWAYPMPAFLVGADVDGKPSFTTVAWGGIANGEPPMISVALRHRRHSYKGIKENFVFSVNVASTDMAREADYCGMVSGSDVDKVAVCGFKVFYGKLGHAPLIEQCPVNLECRVVHILDLGSHALVVGRIEETYVSESCLTDGKPEVSKVKPLGYAEAPDKKYLAVESIARAFSIGKELE